MLDKLSVGTEVNIGDIKAVISSGLLKFKDTLAIYADIIEQDGDKVCVVCKVHNIDRTIAIIARDKQRMEKMNLNTEERKAIYCHELGHIFSQNQSLSKDERIIDDEVDADTYAVEECGILPEILESALKKSYEYEISTIKSKTNLTQTKIDRYIEEMKARKRNVLRLVKEKNKNDIQI